MKKIATLLLFVVLGISCAPKIKSSLSTTNYAPLADDEAVFIVDVRGQFPENSAFVGDLKIGDSGFTTDCGYESVMENARNAARKAGSNFVKLIEIKKPNLGSTCYRIKAQLYRNLDQEALAVYKAEELSKNRSRLPENAEYAIVHFYRPRQFAGSMIGYKIRMDEDSIIGRVRNGEKFAYKTSDFGKHTFWGLTEARDSVVIDVEKGQEYFIRCSLTVGVAVGRPELNLTANHIGVKEYEEMQ